MKTATLKKAPPKADAMERYIGEIDRFAGMLRTQQEHIKEIEKDVAVSRAVYDENKDKLREAKENEHCIEAAQQIAEQFGKSQIIILGWDGPGGGTHVTTYGDTAENKVMAARGGDFVSKYLGLAETQTSIRDFREQFDAGLLQEALGLLKLIGNRQGCTVPMLQQAERICKAAGRGVRSGG